MFKAKLTKDTGETVTITLPQDYLPLSEAVASLGTRLWPEHISMDGNGEIVRGELILDNEMGEHLRRLLPEGYTLQDANDVAHIDTSMFCSSSIPSISKIPNPLPGKSLETTRFLGIFLFA